MRRMFPFGTPAENHGFFSDSRNTPSEFLLLFCNSSSIMEKKDHRDLRSYFHACFFLRGNYFSAFCASGSQYFPTAARAHSFTETMHSGVRFVLRLKCHFHDLYTSFSPTYCVTQRDDFFSFCIRRSYKSDACSHVCRENIDNIICILHLSVK